MPPNLAKIRSYLDARGEAYEIIVVDDGSQDATALCAREAGGNQTRVLRNETNRGKGHSVRKGMQAASGELRLMTDADLSTPIEELGRLLAKMDEGYDIVIASRAVPGARIEVHQPFFREAAGRAFNRIVRLLAVPGIHDTQCGFKLFTAEAARKTFGPGLLDGFSFDVEALFLASKRGLRVAEIPVVWRNDASSRVSALRGAVAFADILRIRVNDLRGLYDRQGL